jgi:hypothetical protein
MRKKQRNMIMMITLLSIAVSIVIMQMVKDTGDIGGDWNTISLIFVDNLPYLFGMGLGFIVLIKNTSHYGSMYSSVLPSVIIGVFMAGMCHSLNTAGVWINDIVTASLTITDLQFILVLFWLFLGIIVGLIRR